MSRLVLIALLWFPIPMAAHSEEKALSTPVAITNVTVIDCTGKDAQPELTVIINGVASHPSVRHEKSRFRRMQVS